MELELVPGQPDQVVGAVLRLLGEAGPSGRRPDRWWQVGNGEALEPFAGADDLEVVSPLPRCRQAASDALRPRRTPGAARA